MARYTYNPFQVTPNPYGTSTPTVPNPYTTPAYPSPSTYPSPGTVVPPVTPSTGRGPAADLWSTPLTDDEILRWRVRFGEIDRQNRWNDFATSQLQVPDPAKVANATAYQLSTMEQNLPILQADINLRIQRNEAQLRALESDLADNPEDANTKNKREQVQSLNTQLGGLVEAQQKLGEINKLITEQKAKTDPNYNPQDRAVYVDGAGQLFTKPGQGLTLLGFMSPNGTFNKNSNAPDADTLIQLQNSREGRAAAAYQGGMNRLSEWDRAAMQAQVQQDTTASSNWHTEQENIRAQMQQSTALSQQDIERLDLQFRIAQSQAQRYDDRIKQTVKGMDDSMARQFEGWVKQGDWNVSTYNTAQQAITARNNRKSTEQLSQYSGEITERSKDMDTALSLALTKKELYLKDLESSKNVPTKWWEAMQKGMDIVAHGGVLPRNFWQNVPMPQGQHVDTDVARREFASIMGTSFEQPLPNRAQFVPPTDVADLAQPTLQAPPNFEDMQATRQRALGYNPDVPVDQQTPTLPGTEANPTAEQLAPPERPTFQFTEAPKLTNLEDVIQRGRPSEHIAPPVDWLHPGGTMPDMPPIAPTDQGPGGEEGYMGPGEMWGPDPASDLVADGAQLLTPALMQAPNPADDIPRASYALGLIANGTPAPEAVNLGWEGTGREWNLQDNWWEHQQEEEPPPEMPQIPDMFAQSDNDPGEFDWSWG